MPTATLKPRTQSLSLTDEEILLLDGACRPEIQAHVDAARARLEAAALFSALPERLAGLVADVISYARAEGRLVYEHVGVRLCAGCGKHGGYDTLRRSSRKGKKGQPDYSKPLLLAGVEMAHSIVRMQGHPKLGCCAECFQTIQPVLAETLSDIAAEVPEKLSGVPPRFQWHPKRRCTKCGWTGHEGQMGHERAVMEGTYPASCPTCAAKNLPFGPTVVESIPGFVLVAR